MSETARLEYHRNVIPSLIREAVRERSPGIGYRLGEWHDEGHIQALDLTVDGAPCRLEFTRGYLEGTQEPSELERSLKEALQRLSGGGTSVRISEAGVTPVDRER